MRRVNARRRYPSLSARIATHAPTLPGLRAHPPRRSPAHARSEGSRCGCVNRVNSRGSHPYGLGSRGPQRQPAASNGQHRPGCGQLEYCCMHIAERQTSNRRGADDETRRVQRRMRHPSSGRRRGAGGLHRHPDAGEPAHHRFGAIPVRDGWEFVCSRAEPIGRAGGVLRGAPGAPGLRGGMVPGRREGDCQGGVTLTPRRLPSNRSPRLRPPMDVGTSGHVLSRRAAGGIAAGPLQVLEERR